MILLHFVLIKATGGQEKQRDAAIHVAASGGSSYLKTVEALLADETISLNSFNTEGTAQQRSLRS